MLEFFINTIKTELKKRLPGFEAQRKMAPSLRLPIGSLNQNKVPKLSSVMIIFYPEKGKINTIFIKRKEDGKAHGGQVAFPGGKFEISDENLMHTAIRETFEEIGVEIPKNQVIGSLTPLFIPISNFEVSPFIAYLKTPPVYILSDKEVEKIITVEADILFNNNNKGEKLITRNNLEITAPFFRANGDIIWGATAMILSELNEIINNSEIDKILFH
jgi:8-oxo-dGTP pyrophosphatase MutT (NUDIX family)